MFDVFCAQNVLCAPPAGGVLGEGTVFRIDLVSAQLDISVAGGYVVLAWPTNLTGFVLQSNANLSAPSWGAVSTQPAIFGDQNVVSNAPASGAVFYRLVK